LKKKLHPIVATYFTRDEHEHYILHSRYLIAKAYGKWKVARLEALTKIMSFKQRNKFAPGALFSKMLATKKERLIGLLGFPKSYKTRLLPFSAR
jgi:hypothetical protein